MANFRLIIILIITVNHSTSLQYTNIPIILDQWIPTSDTTKIVTFENQTVLLPCAMQSFNAIHSTQDQLTLILWYRSWNTSGPPVYSIDFRNTEELRQTQSHSPQHQSATHFISNEQFKNRILLFEFDTCWLVEAHQMSFWFNLSTNQFNYRNFHTQLYDHQYNGTKTVLKPICAFLKLDQVKLKDGGRYSCRMDFRRSRTIHSQLLVKVLERPKYFEIRMNDKRLVNNSIINDLNEGSSLIVICSARMKAPISVSIIRPSAINLPASNPELHTNHSTAMISMKRILTLDADRLTILQCLASGSRPAATCKWSLLNGYEFKSKDYSESTSVESVSTHNSEQLTAATISTLSTLHLLASNQMDNQIIRCTCSNSLISPSIQLTDQIQLKVLSKPIIPLMPYPQENRNKTSNKVELSIPFDNLYKTYIHQVQEDNTVRFVCLIIKSEPSLLGEIRWFINDVEIENYKKIYSNVTLELEPTAGQLSLVIRKVNRKTIGRYYCTARNDKGETQSNLIILNVQYVPFCRPSQKILYSLTAGDTIDINCDIYADLMDPLLQFHWTLDKQPLSSRMHSIDSIINSNDDQYDTNHKKWRPLNKSSLSENEQYSLIRSVLKFNSSNYEFKHATLACWASNTVGIQIEPCLFSLLTIGPPEVPNCSIEHFELDKTTQQHQIEIECKPGKDNGILQTLHLDVYRLMAGGLTINESRSLNEFNKFKLTSNQTSVNRLINQTSSMLKRIDNLTTYEMDNDLFLTSYLLTKHPTTIQHNHFIGQFNHSAIACIQQQHHDLIVNQTIIINQTNKYIRFKRITLSTATVQYLFIIIFASNARGRSSYIEWILESGATNQVTLTELNYFQIIVLSGYFFVGIFCAIVFTYLLFTLALWFPFCLRIQLLIVNHRLLTSSRNKQSNLQDRLFTVPVTTSGNHSFNETTMVRANNVYSNLNDTVRSNGLAIITNHHHQIMPNNSNHNHSNETKMINNNLGRNLLKSNSNIYRAEHMFDKMTNNSPILINNKTHSLSRLTSSHLNDKSNSCRQPIRTDFIRENIYINCTNNTRNKVSIDWRANKFLTFNTKFSQFKRKD